MSKISKTVKYTKKVNYDIARHTNEVEVNFMGGESYTCSPLTTLKLVTASSIYGEPTYYRSSKLKSGRSNNVTCINKLVKDFAVLPYDKWSDMDTTEIMESVIDAALSFDFKATLDWARELRNKFNLRLNPQVIMVRAAVHPDRSKFTTQFPGLFNEYNQEIMSRPDDALSQISYYLYIKGAKNSMPSILKKSLAKKLSSLSRYQIAKYKNHEIGIINAVRLTHANSPILDELMRSGKIEITEQEATWENLRSENKSWKEIFNTCNMGHMALLRNLRNVFTEIVDDDFCTRYLDKLISGVSTSKQLPFRYWSAYNAIESEDLLNYSQENKICNALENCMDIAMSNLPRLSGKTMALSDNSGSAWGTFTSEYGKVTVAEVDNLSAVILAAISDEGYVGAFGDRLICTRISSQAGILAQTKNITNKAKGNSRSYGDGVGGSTENGIWIFFRDAIEKKQFYDNIVIFSDQQAGHGGLYGTSDGISEYKAKNFNVNHDYLNVMDLIIEYRKKVNPKVNVMSVQTGGYTNSVIPENIYRGTIASGWTGQEALLLKATTDIWDSLENLS